MKIVIEIPEKEYQACVRRDVNMTGSISDSYIAQGTVLPKGHGDLIDRTAILDEVALTPVAERNFNNCVECVECVPTIIKADDEVN